MRYAGVGWPNGPTDNERLYALPGSTFLLLDSEHANAAMRWWGQYPFDERSHLVPHNELNLSYERGDVEDDWDPAAAGPRYERVATLLAEVARKLRDEHGFRGALHFPAWSPGQHWREHVERWKPAVDRFDVLDFHEYETLERVRDSYEWLRSHWPDKPLALTEWHGRGSDDVAEERRVLAWLAWAVEEDRNLIGATFFIWRWHPPAPGWTDAWDIEGNEARMALFASPPTAGETADPAKRGPAPKSPEETVWTRAQIVQLSNRIADECQVAREAMLGCAIAESDLRWNARRPPDPADDERFWPDVSAGVWQQAVRWSAEYAGLGLGGGYPGRETTEQIVARYYDPEHAARLAATQIKHWLEVSNGDVLDALCRYNWPARAPSANPNRENYRRGIAEARKLLGLPGPQPAATLRFDPATPAVLQPGAWQCSAATLAWMLESIGRPTSVDQAVVALGPRIDPEVGLVDASGAGLVQTLAELGLRGGSLGTAGWDDAVARVGLMPVAIGGRGWYHWVGVRRATPGNGLELANPSPGWKGVGDMLSRDQWDQFGPFALVWIELTAEEEMAPVEELEKKVNGLVTALAHVCDIVIEPLAAKHVSREQRIEAVRQARQIREQFLGPRPTLPDRAA